MTGERGSVTFTGVDRLVHQSIRQIRDELIARRTPPYPQIVDPSILRTGDLLHTVDKLEKIPRLGYIVLSVHPDGTFQTVRQTVNCLPDPHLHALEGSPIGLSVEESRRFTQLFDEDGAKSFEERLRKDEWLKEKGFKETVRGLKSMGILPENDGADRANARWFYLLGAWLVQPSPLA